MAAPGAYPSRVQIQKLFEPAAGELDKEKLVSKFLNSELHRLDQAGVEPAGDPQTRLKLLQWYISRYTLRRHNEFVRVPLSAEQIDYLNSPMPLAGLSSAVTIGLYNAVIDELPDRSDLRDPVKLRYAVYWWCIKFTPVRRLDDRLVIDDQIKYMCAEEQWFASPFALTNFMIEFVDDHKELAFLSLDNPRDRAALLSYLFLLSFSMPIISRMLPRAFLRHSLKGNGPTTALQRVLGRFIFDNPDDPRASALIATGGELTEAYGFNYKTGWAPQRLNNGNSGDCFAGSSSQESPIEDGVAIIGPIYSTSGLGQAIRLSHATLAATEVLRPTVHPFHLDNPAPLGSGSPIAFETYERRRRINLIHLNAEFVPLAFANMPRAIFESSYNVGYFFWEFNELPEQQLLALEMLDEIWVASEYGRATYSKYTQIPVINVGMAIEPLPKLKAIDRSTLDVGDGTFVFVTIFDSFSFIERKNPIAVIDSFRRAFPKGNEDVRLILKTQNRQRVYDPYQLTVWRKIDRAILADDRIILIDETYKYHDLLALKFACDCYVSLHRSEGWGFGIIEAMQLGRPVICTGYSGNMDFCSIDTANLVDHTMIAPTREQYLSFERGSMWADPNIASAAAHMRAVVSDRATAVLKAERAKAYVEATFSVAAIAARYGARLAEIRTIMESPSRPV